MKNHIEGLIFEKIKTHADERGFFREISRNQLTNPAFTIQQLSHSLVNTGITKAWHGHRGQTQLTYLASGSAVFAFVDNRDSARKKPIIIEKLASPNHEPWCVLTPPGVYIGYYCTQGPANVVYATSGIYEVEDELRIVHDDQYIGYSWDKWKSIR